MSSVVNLPAFACHRKEEVPAPGLLRNVAEGGTDAAPLAIGGPGLENPIGGPPDVGFLFMVVGLHQQHFLVEGVGQACGIPGSLSFILW